MFAKTNTVNTFDAFYGLQNIAARPSCSSGSFVFTPMNLQRQMHPRAERVQRANPNDNNSDGRRVSSRVVMWINRPTDAFAGEARIADDTIYGINPFPHLESPLCVVDDDNGGAVIHWSRSMIQLTGLSEDQMLG